MKNVKFDEISKASNWLMTVESKKTRSGQVLFIHTVYFKGEVYDTRKSKREYELFWLDIVPGCVSIRAAQSLKLSVEMAKEYRAKAAAGGENPFPGYTQTPELFTVWANALDEQTALHSKKLAEIEEAGVEYDWAVFQQGYSTWPNRVKGNLAIAAKRLKR